MCRPGSDLGSSSGGVARRIPVSWQDSGSQSSTCLLASRSWCNRRQHASVGNVQRLSQSVPRYRGAQAGHACRWRRPSSRRHASLVQGLSCAPYKTKGSGWACLQVEEIQQLVEGSEARLNWRPPSNAMSPIHLRNIQAIYGVLPPRALCPLLFWEEPRPCASAAPFSFTWCCSPAQPCSCGHASM